MDIKKENPIFNTPMEIGMRMVYLLIELYPKKYDVFYLSYLDYAISYSKDLNGPESLHTPVKKRGGAFLNNIDILRESLHKMSHYDFINIEVSDKGISYYAGENARAIVNSIKTDYSSKLEDRCRWVAQFIKNKSYEDIVKIFEVEGKLWGYDEKSSIMVNVQ